MTSARRQAVVFLIAHLLYVLTWGIYVNMNHFAPFDEVVNVIFTKPTLNEVFDVPFAIKKWAPVPANWAGRVTVISRAYATLSLISFAVFLWGYKKGKLEHRILRIFCWSPMAASILFYLAIFIAFSTEPFFLLVTLTIVAFFLWKIFYKSSAEQNVPAKNYNATRMSAAQVLYWVMLCLYAYILLIHVEILSSGDFHIFKFYVLVHLFLFALYVVLVVVSTSLYLWARKKDLLYNSIVSKICSLPMVLPTVLMTFLAIILPIAMMPMKAAKPVIYLYPEKTTDVSVKLVSVKLKRPFYVVC